MLDELDAALPEVFYRAYGYHVCGPRAVRIDMLERLGDLIRARVFWKPAFPDQPRPAGSMPGGGFTVIPDMMSLVGCSGEEFSGVLRALGFQAEERRVPVEPKAVDAESAPAAPDATEPAGEPGAEAATGDPEVPAPGGPDVPTPADPQPPVPAEPDVPAPDEPRVPVPDEPEAPPPGDPDATRAPEPQAAGPAETVIQVWWPKDTGPFRKQARRPNKASETKPRHNRPRGKPAQGPDTVVRDGKHTGALPDTTKRILRDHLLELLN